MSKKVCIVVDIDDVAYDLMYGGRTGDGWVVDKKKPAKEAAITVPIFEADLTTSDGKSFQSDALNIMLLAERQKVIKMNPSLLGYSEHPEEHPDLFTTKE